MQEQPSYKTTPDQAWTNMKSLLDEAMPIHPNRNRPVFYWWTASVVAVILLTGAVIVNNSAQNGLDATHPLPGVLPASTPAPLTNDKSPATIKQSQQQSISPATIETKSDHDAGIKSDAPVLNHRNSNSPAQSASPIATPPMADIDTEKADHEMLLNTQKHDDAITTQLQLQSAPNETSVDEEILIVRDAILIEPLPTADHAALLPDVNSSNEVGPIVPGKRLNQPGAVRPYAMVNGLGGFDNGLGWNAGAGVDISLNKKFAATTSVAYFSYHPNSSVFPTANDLEALPSYDPIFYTDPSSGPENVYVNENLLNATTGYTSVDPLVDRVEQWQWNGGVKYRITPRFFTEAGVQLGLFTKAYSNYSFASIDLLSNKITEVDQNALLNDYDVVRSTTTSLYGTIGLRLGRHVDLTAGISYGLHHYLLNDNASISQDQSGEERTDYIRGVTLGMRYNL